MRIYISEFSDQGIKYITLEHGDQAYTCRSKTYIRASRMGKRGNNSVDPNNDLVFKEINSYLGSLDGKDQTAIWEIYQSIFEMLSGSFDILSIQGKLQNHIKDLYKILDYKNLYQWASMSEMIHLPIKLKTEYSKDDSEELTYLRSDYFDLIVLAIAMRLMVPIWSMFIPLIKSEVDNTFKEFIAAKLLYRSSIINTEPYQRLKTYIEASIENKGGMKNNGNMFSAMLSGLSTSSFPDWLLANTIVRRTSIVPLISDTEGPNIITDVYQYVVQSLRSPGRRRFSGYIREKQIRKNDSFDKEESLAESYKIKQKVSDGDVITANVYASKPYAVATSIDPNVDQTKIDQCLQWIDGISNKEINRFQITIIQWMVVKTMSVHYVPLLDKQVLLKLMAACQAILWDWGFNDIASLLTASEIRLADEFVSMQESRTKIPNVLMDELIKIYPNNYRSKNKNVSLRKINPGSVAVDAVFDLISNADWYINGPTDLLRVTDHVKGDRKMYVPADIRIQLAQLLIKLYENRSEYDQRKTAMNVG